MILSRFGNLETRTPVIEDIKGCHMICGLSSGIQVCLRFAISNPSLQTYGTQGVAVL